MSIKNSVSVLALTSIALGGCVNSPEKVMESKDTNAIESKSKFSLGDISLEQKKNLDAIRFVCDGAYEYVFQKEKCIKSKVDFSLVNGEWFYEKLNQWKEELELDGNVVGKIDLNFRRELNRLCGNSPKTNVCERGLVRKDIETFEKLIVEGRFEDKNRQVYLNGYFYYLGKYL